MNAIAASAGSTSRYGASLWRRMNALKAARFGRRAGRFGRGVVRGGPAASLPPTVSTIGPVISNSTKRVGEVGGARGGGRAGLAGARGPWPDMATVQERTK